MKKLLYVVIGIFVLYIILAFAGPKDIKIEREIAIGRPVEIVKEKLGDFKFFHERWNPWTIKDPNMNAEYSGTPGQPGHTYQWSGNDEVGSGEMSIAGYNGDTLLQDFSFERGDLAQTYFITKNNKTYTAVIWGMKFAVPFFQRPAMLFMNMDEMLGTEYEKGLAVLKQELENDKGSVTPTNYTIIEQNWPDVTYIGKKEKISLAAIPQYLEKHFSALWNDLQKFGVTPQSMPTGIFMNYNEEKAESEVIAAAKVTEDPKLKGWEKFTFDKCKVLHVVYYGDYNKSMIAHKQIGDYMKEKNLKESAVIEEYVTDPGSEKDTAKWRTNIYYLLK